MAHYNYDPVGEVDYPRTLQEFDEWFLTEIACVDYFSGFVGLNTFDAIHAMEGVADARRIDLVLSM